MLCFLAAKCVSDLACDDWARRAKLLSWSWSESFERPRITKNEVISSFHTILCNLNGFAGKTRQNPGMSCFSSKKSWDVAFFLQCTLGLQEKRDISNWWCRIFPKKGSIAHIQLEQGHSLKQIGDNKPLCHLRQLAKQIWGVGHLEPELSIKTLYDDFFETSVADVGTTGTGVPWRTCIFPLPNSVRTIVLPAQFWKELTKNHIKKKQVVRGWDKLREKLVYTSDL